MAVPEELLAALGELEGDVHYNETEWYSEILREIGFHTDFENAEDFVREIIAKMTTRGTK